jgi:CubicO group peptidase (beta-lactamase class C family)|tara:strand:- start:621 stop:1967 length:1347 start_codon:yes stop_codon:yes gene_type:complete
MYSDKTNNTWMRNAAGIALLAFLTACNPAPSSTEQVAVPAPVVTAKALEQVAPEQVGMDSGRLDRLTTAMQGYVDDGLLSGVVTMASRGNKIVHYESVGYRDVEAQAPMTPDTIFRIYSMTKPVTGAALMILYEEGKFKLSDPVGKYIPELADLQVFAGVDDDGNMITEPADHPMTIRELMSHTGGLSYGIFAQSGVDTAYVEAGILDANDTNAEFVAKLGQIPLKHQPGSRWEYSVAVDVQGYLVEVLSGQTFGEFLNDRLFEPLGMTDTDFHVPEEKLNRFAQMYVYGPEGQLIPSEMFPTADFTVDMAFESGGGGLVSTANDYMRFSQMLLNGGELDGERILAPLTVALMSRDQTPKGMEGPMSGAGNGTVFGLDFAVIVDPVEAESYSAGEYYWGGAAGTWFWIDPVEDVVFIGMIQQAGQGLPDVRSASRRLFYQAIMEPNGV